MANSGVVMSSNVSAKNVKNLSMIRIVLITYEAMRSILLTYIQT